MNNFFKILLIVVEVGAIAYIVIGFFLVLWQTRLIFLPSSVIEVTPDQLGLPYEDVWIPVPDAPSTEKIHGWWLPHPSATDVLLYLHGNGQNIGANIGQAQRYYQLGFSVLLIDYRGYGLSKGKFPHEAQVYQDAEAAWNYLVQHIEPQQIFLYGHSLGGAIAIDLAVRHSEAAGLIVEGTFTSMQDIVHLRPGYRLLPINWLLTQRFDSIRKIKSLQVPLLLIHGSDDLVVPASMSQVLYEAATVPKQILIVPGAGHNNVAAVGDTQYLEAVRRFRQLVQKAGGREQVTGNREQGTGDR